MIGLARIIQSIFFPPLLKLFVVFLKMKMWVVGMFLVTVEGFVLFCPIEEHVTFGSPKVERLAIEVVRMAIDFL